MPTKPGVAPLRAITSTATEPTSFMGVPATNVIHTLECGHKAEPLLRVGCRQGKEPRRRRCKECLKGVSDE
jgi:hypothetical protein